MTYNFLREGGVGALACVATNSATLLQCTFQAEHNPNSSHATFSLQHAIHVHGFNEAQDFRFIYDADNLVPATTTCMTAETALAITELGHIARNRVAEVRALSLNLKKPCAILCPNVPESFSPKPSHEVVFDQLVDLAKATEITILFDWKWLHQRHHGPFLTIVSQPEKFSGFPIEERNLKERRLEDWSIFSPTEQYLSNDPPSYAEASRKRTRQIVSSSPPPSPPPKRVFYIPEGSPTVKASTPSTPNRQPSPTVEESPRAGSPHIPPHLEDTMRKMMQQMIPEMLAQFIDKPRSMSASPPPSDSSSITPSVRFRRPLRAFLSARAAAYAEKKLTSICENTVYDAQYLRTAADEEFISAVEEQKLDMQARKDDALEELQEDIDKMVDEKLRELDATVAEYMEEVEEQVESVIDKKLDGLLDGKLATDVAPCTTEAIGRKTKRDGRSAGDRKRYRFGRRVR